MALTLKQVNDLVRGAKRKPSEMYLVMPDLRDITEATISTNLLILGDRDLDEDCIENDDDI